MPDEPPVVAARHRVDRAQRGRRRRQLVDRRGDVLLVRHRHRQPADAERAHRVERGGGRAGRDVERDVRPVEPAGRERRVVQRRRQGVADRVADDGGDVHGDGRSQDAGGDAAACDVGLVLLGRDGERVVAVLVGEHVVQVLARRRPRAAGADRVADARVRRRVERGRGSTPGRGWRSASAAGPGSGTCCTGRRLALLLERDRRRVAAGDRVP